MGGLLFDKLLIQHEFTLSPNEEKTVSLIRPGFATLGASPTDNSASFMITAQSSIYNFKSSNDSYISMTNDNASVLMIKQSVPYNKITLINKKNESLTVFISIHTTGRH